MGYCPRCYASADASTPKCPFDGTTAKPTPNPDKLIGAEVLGSKIIRRIGEGLSGTVYLAHHRTTSAPSAIKVIRSEWLAHPHLVERFESEARTLASIEHLNIVKVMASGTLAESGVPTDKRLFVQMEHVQGTTLAARIKERTRIPMAEAIPLARQICRGLEAAHERGIVHRDLRPQNVFLTGDPARPTVKLLGFGSDQVPAFSDATEIDVRIGVADYMPPEQLTGGIAAMTTASDLYSLGAIMFEMAAGRGPDPRKDVERRPTPRQLLEGVVARIDEFVSPAYESVILKCLSKEPAKRYSSANSVSRVLEAAAEVPVTPAKQKNRGVGVLIAAGIGVVVLIGAVVFTLAPRSRVHGPGVKRTGFSAFFGADDEPTPAPTPEPETESHLHAHATMPTANRPHPKHESAGPLPGADVFALPDTAPQPVAAASSGVPQPCLKAEESDGQAGGSCDAKHAKWAACLADIAQPGHEVPGAVKARYEKREESLQIICQLDALAFAPDCKEKTKALATQAHAKGLHEAESAAQDALKGCP